MPLTPPPREVLRCMTRVERLIASAPDEDLRLLRSTRECVTIVMVKFVMEHDVKEACIDLGFAAEWGCPDSRHRTTVRLAKVRWLREMEDWDSMHWAWFFALVVAQASDTLPTFGDTGGGRSASVDISLQPSYKMAPTCWEALHAELPECFDSVLADARFRAEGCCLRHVRGPEVVWSSPAVDALGDPALQFDTGFMWRRAADLLCAPPLEDRTARPGIRYLVGGGERVLDGKGRWHASSREYIRARLQAAASPLPQGERDNVEGFVWEVVSALEVGTAGGLDRNADGSMATAGDTIGLYLQKRSKQVGSTGSQNALYLCGAWRLLPAPEPELSALALFERAVHENKAKPASRLKAIREFDLGQVPSESGL